MNEEQQGQVQPVAEDDLLMRAAWYIRYPIAAIILFGVLWATNSNIEIRWFWWVCIAIALFSAAIYARELVLLILACGVMYLLFLLLASVPVGIAIIIGAIIGATIIASALGK